MQNAKQSLLNLLAELTAERGWSHTEMARQLDIAQETWAAVRSGDRDLPLATATLVADKWPALKWVANSYVLEQVKETKARRKVRQKVVRE